MASMPPSTPDPTPSPAADSEPAPADIAPGPVPATDPEHGDLTPDYVRWFLHNHSEAECRAKYGTRVDKLPRDCQF